MIESNIAYLLALAWEESPLYGGIEGGFALVQLAPARLEYLMAVSQQMAEAGDIRRQVLDVLPGEVTLLLDEEAIEEAIKEALGEKEELLWGALREAGCAVLDLATSTALGGLAGEARGVVGGYDEQHGFEVALYRQQGVVTLCWQGTEPENEAFFQTTDWVWEVSERQKAQ